MPLLLPSSALIVWINRVTSIIAFINNSILLAVVINNYYKRAQIDCIYSKRLYYSLLFAIMPYIFMSIGSGLFTTDIFIQLFGCPLIHKYMLITYYSAKFFLWNYALMRLRAVFTNSALQYKTKFINILQIMFIIAGIICIISAMVTTSGDTEIINKKLITCIVEINNIPIGVFVPSFLDTTISFLCFYLFYKKMKELYNKANESNTNKEEAKKDVELMYIVRKYLILLVASISTSYLLLAAVSTTALNGTFGAIDGMINTWCLLLFDIKYDAIYRRIFVCCAINKAMQKYMNEKSINTASGTSKVVMELDDYMKTTENRKNEHPSSKSPEVEKPKTNHFEVQLHGFKDASSDCPVITILPASNNKAVKL